MYRCVRHFNSVFTQTVCMESKRVLYKKSFLQKGRNEMINSYFVNDPPPPPEKILELG
jgi:hypothetical protein